MIYWRPGGGSVSVPVPWWLASVASPPEVSPVQTGGADAIWAVVVIAVYCYIGVALALCYIRLGITRGLGAIRKRGAFG